MGDLTIFLHWQILLLKKHKDKLPGTSAGLTNKEAKTHEATFNTDGKQQN